MMELQIFKCSLQSIQQLYIERCTYRLASSCTRAGQRQWLYARTMVCGINIRCTYVIWPADSTTIQAQTYLFPLMVISEQPAQCTLFPLTPARRKGDELTRIRMVDAKDEYHMQLNTGTYYTHCCIESVDDRCSATRHIILS